MANYLQMFEYERLATKPGLTRSKSVKVNQTDMMSRCKGDKRKETPAFLLVRHSLGVGGWVLVSLPFALFFSAANRIS
jgi:hypothetical protein